MSAAVAESDRARVLGDRDLRRAWKRAFAGPGGVAALRRADDPERLHKGRPSPFAGYEQARRRVFAPGATDRDRDAWRRLQAARAAELVRVDAAVTTVLTALPRPVAPRVPSPVPARRTRRGRIVVGAAIAAALVLAVVAAGTALPRADPSPPPLAGRPLATLTGTAHSGGGSRTVQAAGEAVAFALTCTGRGEVAVSLGPGEHWRLACASGTILRASDAPHGRVTVRAAATGNATWALRVVARPVGSFTSQRAEECGGCVSAAGP